MIGRPPSSVSTLRASRLAGHVGEDLGELGVVQIGDLGAEEDFGGALGGGQARVAVDEPRQLLGQAALAVALGRRRRRGPRRAIRFLRAAASVSIRRHLPTSASSTLIQY